MRHNVGIALQAYLYRTEQDLRELLAETELSDGFVNYARGIEGVDLSVARGEIFGFLGPNGAGKTTTLKLLMQLVYPPAGHATILGRPLGLEDLRFSEESSGFAEVDLEEFADLLEGRRESIRGCGRFADCPGPGDTAQAAPVGRANGWSERNGNRASFDAGLRYL